MRCRQKIVRILNLTRSLKYLPPLNICAIETAPQCTREGVEENQARYLEQGSGDACGEDHERDEDHCSENAPCHIQVAHCVFRVGGGTPSDFVRVLSGFNGQGGSV